MERIYRVRVGEEVSIDCLRPEAPEFDEVQEAVIHREGVTIEHFHNNASAGTLPGDHYFSSLDNARSYALLNLQAVQQRLSANINRVLNYADGEQPG